jgi:hypothetical protein
MTNLFWKAIGATKPKENTPKRKTYKREFQRLWIAGTLGAFFTALARNLPVDLKEVSWPFQTDHTIDRFVRYGYLLWLLTYFFSSSVENQSRDEVKKWDITYDVLQSVCSLTAAYFLGFILPDQHYGLSAYAITNGAIFVICMFSLLWFGRGATLGVNRLRAAGVVISAVSVSLALLSTSQTYVLLAFGGLQVCLWAVLLAYIRIRLDV